MIMPATQQIVYESLRALGYAYVSTDASDGSIDVRNRTTNHCLCLYANGQIYEIVNGKYCSVTFHRNPTASSTK